MREDARVSATRRGPGRIDARRLQLRSLGKRMLLRAPTLAPLEVPGAFKCSGALYRFMEELSPVCNSQGRVSSIHLR